MPSQAAKQLQPEEGEEGEEGPSKPVFGHLHILLRDCSASVNECEEILLSPEVVEGAVDAFTLAAAAPPTSVGASLFNNFCYIRGRCLTLWDTLYEDIYAAEYLASRPVAHSPHWPFQRFISYSEDPSRAYADLIVNAALASRLQTAEGVLARSWHHASAIWHGSNARAPSPPRGAFYRRRPQEDGALRSAS